MGMHTLLGSVPQQYMTCNEDRWHSNMYGCYCQIPLLDLGDTSTVAIIDSVMIIGSVIYTKGMIFRLAACTPARSFLHYCVSSRTVRSRYGNATCGIQA